MSEDLILCVSSAYEEKFYFNPRYHTLPKAIREELQIICVMHTMEVGGVLTVSFDEEGHIYLTASSTEEDFAYDEIGANLLLKRMQQEKAEFFEGLELYYVSFFLNS
ncbi:MAG: DUF6145 family protein [Lachnoclostridium sp.]|jgi:hypothetical protein|nr:DUF6145 family protein [Lachnoclostridium sp.]